VLWSCIVDICISQGSAATDLRETDSFNSSPFSEFNSESYEAIGLPRWLSGLRHIAHRPERSVGGAGFNPRVGR